MSGRTIKAADLFCGAGGTSRGLFMACQQLSLTLDLVAVNHWPLAIQTHMANNPWARHICASLTAIDTPAEGTLFANGVDAVDPRKAVPSGKLDLLVASPECTHHSVARGGMPMSDQSRASPWCVLRWVDATRPESVLLENVREFQDWGPLNKRNRPIQSRKGETFRAWLTALASMGYAVEHRILTCADYGDATTRPRLFVIARRGASRIEFPAASHSRTGAPGTSRWRAAREVIDLERPSRSIFGRKVELRPATIARIAHGLKKFGGAAAEPFLVMLYGTNTSRSIARPLPTVTAGGQHIGLCQPFLVKYHGGADSARRVHSVDEPLPTQDCSNDAPLPTITGTRAYGLIQPYLVKYYRTGRSQSLALPLDTITCKARFGLVQPVLYESEDGPVYMLDILFRMLQPDELAGAMGFPPEYLFLGTQGQQVKQIGNAVPCHTACALTKWLVAA